MGRMYILAGGVLLVLFAGLNTVYHGRAVAQKADSQASGEWVAEIEKNEIGRAHV